MDKTSDECATAGKTQESCGYEACASKEEVRNAIALFALAYDDEVNNQNNTQGKK